MERYERRYTRAYHIYAHTQSCREYYLLSNRYRGGIVSTDKCEDKFDWSESKGERFGSITLVNEHPRHASPPNRKENLTFVAFESTGSSSFSSGRKWMERVDISNWRIGIRRSSLHIYICIGIYQIIPLGQPVSRVPLRSILEGNIGFKMKSRKIRSGLDWNRIRRDISIW